MKTYDKKDYSIVHEAPDYYLVKKRGSTKGAFKINKEQYINEK